MAVIAELVDELRTVGAELVDLGRVARLLSWDQETMMPRRGAPWRARQRAALQGLYHERKILATIMEQRVEYNEKLGRYPTIEDRLRFGGELVSAIGDALLADR